MNNYSYNISVYIINYWVIDEGKVLKYLINAGFKCGLVVDDWGVIVCEEFELRPKLWSEKTEFDRFICMDDEFNKKCNNCCNESHGVDNGCESVSGKVASVGVFETGVKFEVQIGKGYGFWIDSSDVDVG